MYPNVKRGLDILFSSVMLVLGAIPLLITALIIKIDSPGPAIFKHKRLGAGGKVFEMLKFRSMVV
ncbi:MAG: sugar transferase, partial [Clostridium sp.]|nr:sugar transferase [Clostridium sp.]